MPVRHQRSPRTPDREHRHQRDHLASELDPNVGDYLLLPYGSADFVVQVLSKAHGRVKVQFLNKKDRTKDPTSNLRLVWYRTIPSSNVFDDDATDEHEEVYQDKLTNAQLAAGFLPWTDTFDLDDFYQHGIAPSAIKKTAQGWTLNKLKRTLIRKHKPSHQK